MSALTQVIQLIWKLCTCFWRRTLQTGTLHAFGTADLVYEIQISNVYGSVAMRILIIGWKIC